MPDSIIKIGNSTIQHGHENERIYLMKLDSSDLGYIIPVLNDLALKHNYSKIFAKVSRNDAEVFLQDGYIEEAVIERFYKGQDDALFLSKYFSQDRAYQKDSKVIEDVLTLIKQKEYSKLKINLKEEFKFRKCTIFDAEIIAELYSSVFETYPFPITDPTYIKETMKKNVDYFGIWEGDKLIALSSSEFDFEENNAEMTDFAVLPQYRGKNLSEFLLVQMEFSALEQGVKTAYTIARCLSYPINNLFAKNGYIYAGTLTNNTNICGQIESMNVWYKNFV